MGRKSTLDEAQVFAAVGQILSATGQITLQNVVTETGVSIGSLYHRFASREGLLASAWIDSVQHFQKKFLLALENGKEDAGEQAAMLTPRYCREEYERAIILVCCRKSEFMSEQTPEDLRKAIDSINAELVTAIREYAEKNQYPLEACHMGLIAFPLGAVRFYLPHTKVPESVDHYVLQAYRSAIQQQAL